MDDYLLRDIPASLDFITKHTGFARVHWIGHSMGGMLLYAYVAAFGAEKVAAAATLGAPPGFDGVNFQTPHAVFWLQRLCPPLFQYILKGITPLLNVWKPRFRFVPVNWDNIHTDVTPRTFFNVIEAIPPRAAQELAGWATTKTWRMRNGELDVLASLKKLQIPIFAIFGGADALTPGQNARAFFEALPADYKKMLILSKESGYAEDYDHVDLAFGKNGVADVFEPIAEWLKKHPIAKQRDAGRVAAANP